MGSRGWASQREPAPRRPSGGAQGVAGAEKANENQSFAAAVVLDNLMGQPPYRPGDLVRPKKRLGAHEKRLPRWAGQAYKRAYGCWPDIPAPPPLPASRDRLKGHHERTGSRSFPQRRYPFFGG